MRTISGLYSPPGCEAWCAAGSVTTVMIICKSVHRNKLLYLKGSGREALDLTKSPEIYNQACLPPPTSQDKERSTRTCETKDFPNATSLMEIPRQVAIVPLNLTYTASYRHLKPHCRTRGESGEVLASRSPTIHNSYQL